MDTNTVEIVTKFGEKLDSYIAVLASKAGVAADHFWPVIVKQQVIEGWCGIGVMAFCFIGFLISLTVLLKSIPNSTDDDNFKPKNVAGVICGGIFGFIFFFATCINTSEIGCHLSKISNPEYSAIQSLVKMVK